MIGCRWPGTQLKSTRWWGTETVRPDLLLRARVGGSPDPVRCPDRVCTGLRLHHQFIALVCYGAQTWCGAARYLRGLIFDSQARLVAWAIDGQSSPQPRSPLLIRMLHCFPIFPRMLAVMTVPSGVCGGGGGGRCAVTDKVHEDGVGATRQV